MDKLLADHEIHYIVSRNNRMDGVAYYVAPKDGFIEIAKFLNICEKPSFAVPPDESYESDMEETPIAAVLTWKLPKDG